MIACQNSLDGVQTEGARGEAKGAKLCSAPELKSPRTPVVRTIAFQAPLDPRKHLSTMLVGCLNTPVQLWKVCRGQGGGKSAKTVLCAGAKSSRKGGPCQNAI